MFDLKMVTQKRGEIEAIQRRFKNNLSDREIKKMTKEAINYTMKSAISNKSMGINASVKNEYNIKQKSLKGNSIIKPYAKDTALYAKIQLNKNPINIIAFNPKASKSGVAVSIKRGLSAVLPHAFIATMPSGHRGVYGRGRYVGNKWVHAIDLPKGSGKGKRYTSSTTGRKREAITELNTASIFTMGLSDKVAPQINNYIGTTVLTTLEQKLQRLVAAAAKG